MEISERLLKLVDHVEIQHEREIAPATTEVQIARMHVDMHRQGDESEQWNHVHKKDGEVVWRE